MKPVRLDASFREKVWGTTELEPWFPRSEKPIGEVWLTASPPLPILVKFLYAAAKLSVQVHPDDGADGSPGKTEMWHILRAEPGASIAMGFEKPLTREEVREAARTGAIERLLRWVPVAAGETYFTPPGTVHAIGPGIALCEIQQNTDITYRLYDYGRDRELHVDDCLRVAKLVRHPGPVRPVALGCGHDLLVKCRHFATESLRLRGEWECAASELRFEILICVAGEGRMGEEPFRAGEAWLAPAGCPPFRVRPEGAAHFLRTYVPEAAAANGSSE